MIIKTKTPAGLEIYSKQPKWALLCSSTHYWQYFAFIGTIQLGLPAEVESWGSENILIFESALECQSHINTKKLSKLTIKQTDIETL
jgi:hypothetical protein